MTYINFFFGNDPTLLNSTAVLRFFLLIQFDYPGNYNGSLCIVSVLILFFLLKLSFPVTSPSSNISMKILQKTYENMSGIH